MYGPSLKSEAINTIINKSVDNYLKENKVDVLGDLITENFIQNEEEADANAPLKFSFHMAIKPEINYPAVESIAITYPEIQIEEAKITDFVVDLQKRYGPMGKGESIKEGDLIKGTLKAKDGSFELADSSFPFSKIKEGYQTQFIGKKVGETIEVPIEEAFDKEELKYVTGNFGKNAVDKEFTGLFTFEVSEINTQEPAELNQEFFDKVVGKDQAQNEAELREKVKEMFRDTYEQESESFYQLSLEKHIFDNTKMVLAEDVVQKVISGRVKGKMSEQEVVDFIPRYINSMKMSLIKNQIAADNKIQLSEQDLVEAAKRKLSRDFQQMGYGKLGDEFLDQYAVTYLNEKDKNNRDNMAEQSLSAKIAALVLEKGKIVRKAVPIEEFNKLVEELN
jgi:trigger factor